MIKIKIVHPKSQKPDKDQIDMPTISSSSMKLRNKSKILGFTDFAYIEYAIRWYHRLTDLGYTEHVIVTVDMNSTQYLRNLRRTTTSTTTTINNSNIRFEELPYKPCIHQNPRHGQLVEGFHKD